MNQPRRSRRVLFIGGGAAALLIALLASSGAVGYAARIIGVSGSEPVAAQYPPAKVTICHHTHSTTNPFVTITVSERAQAAHLAHGDTIGACPPQAAVSVPKHGKPATKGQGRQHANLQKEAKKNHARGHERSAPQNNVEQAPGHLDDVAGRQSELHGQAGTHGHGLAKGHVKQHSIGHGHGQGHGAIDHGRHGAGNDAKPADHGHGGHGEQDHGNPGGGKGHSK